MLLYDKLNFGCGDDKRPGYLNADINPDYDPDVLLQEGDLSVLPKDHFTEVFAKDVLEHIPRPKTLDALLEFASLLRLHGRLFLQTTSISQLGQKLKENPRFADQYSWTLCMFGTQARIGDYHYTGFTDTTLTVYVVAAGFQVQRKSMVDDWLIQFYCEKVFHWENLLSLRIGNQEFVAFAYEQFFCRPVDDIGRLYYGGKLDAGEPRRSVLKEIATSPEHLYAVANRLGL